jgi:hypothetical protein
MSQPMEQRGADLGFQILDLLTERRLANTNPGGCAGEIEFFSNGEKISNVAQFHG